MGIEAAVMLGAILLGDPGHPPTLRAGEFEAWFASAAGRDLEVPPSVMKQARGFRYVFVGGFRNERMPGYFAQNIAELRALGVRRGAIDVIQPGSTRTIEGNAAEVKARFLEVAGEGPEKLVIVGHSRGACDALAFALANPRFVEGRVEALFLVQGPFGGSGVAEYVLGRGTPMDRRMPWRHRILGNLAGRLARAAGRRSGLAVVEAMTPEASRAFWARTLIEQAGSIAVVGPRTFFVRTEVRPSRLRFVRRAIAWYLQVYHGPSDGMVALADQALPALGTLIGPIEAGHADLTQRFPATRTHRRMRQALIRSIAMTVGRSRPPRGVDLDPRPDAVPDGQTSLQADRRRGPDVPPTRRVVAPDS